MTDDPSNVPPPPARVFHILLRSEQEVIGRRRTIAHFLQPHESDVHIDDRISLRSAGWQDGRWHHIAEATVVDVQFGRLSSFVDADLAGLLADSREEYQRRWDAKSPAHPFDSDPEVMRVVWRYDAPECAIAMPI
jgi:hypothetical protein